MIQQLHEWGYWCVPWHRTPRKPMVDQYLTKRRDPAGFLSLFPDADWAVVPTTTVVLDLEMKGGLDGLRDIQEFGLLVPGAITQTKSGGFHYWYRQPEGLTLTGGFHIRPGVEAKAINGSVHVPPSVGYSPVSPLVAPENMPPLPQNLIDAWLSATRKRASAGATYKVPTYANGERRQRMCSMAGKLRSIGLCEAELDAALLAIRDCRCEDPNTFTDTEVHGIARDYAKRPERGDLDSWWPASSQARGQGAG